MQQEQASTKDLKLVQDQILQLLETVESTLQLGLGGNGTAGGASVAHPNEIMAQFNTILAKTKGISMRIQQNTYKNHVVSPHILYLQDPGKIA